MIAKLAEFACYDKKKLYRSFTIKIFAQRKVGNKHFAITFKPAAEKIQSRKL